MRLLLQSKEHRHLPLPQLQFIETKNIHDDVVPLLPAHPNDAITVQTLDGLAKWLITDYILLVTPWSTIPFIVPEQNMQTINVSIASSMGIYDGIVPRTSAQYVITIVDVVRKRAHEWLTVDRVPQKMWRHLPLTFELPNKDWEQQQQDKEDEEWIELALER